MTDLGALYREHVADVSAWLPTSPTTQLATTVPATPRWTVRPGALPPGRRRQRRADRPDGRRPEPGVDGAARRRAGRTAGRRAHRRAAVQPGRRGRVAGGQPVPGRGVRHRGPPRRPPRGARQAAAGRAPVAAGPRRDAARGSTRRWPTRCRRTSCSAGCSRAGRARRCRAGVPTCRPRSSTRCASSARARTTSPFPPRGRLMASYAVNEDAVARCRELIEAKQYVLDSDWGDVQPNADGRQRLPRPALVGRVRRLAPRPDRGRERRDQGALRVRLRRPAAGAPHRADRLRLPRLRVAAQGGRAGRPRPAAGARQGRRHRLSPDSSAAARWEHHVGPQTNRARTCEIRNRRARPRPVRRAR